MLVGELIDLLEPYRGRGDSVIVEGNHDDCYGIVAVRWDNDTVIIDVDLG